MPRSRRNKLKDRRPKKRQLFHGLKVTVYCEGIGDELYLRRLNELKIFPNLQITPKSVDSKTRFNLRRRLRVLKSENEDAKFAVLLDMDNGNSADLYQQLIQVAKEFTDSTETVVFFNNYSLELFILNHFQTHTYSNKSLKKDDYKKDLQKVSNLPQYKGSQSDWEKITTLIDSGMVQQALTNMKKIQHDPKANPSSNMNAFFDYLKRLNEQL